MFLIAIVGHFKTHLYVPIFPPPSSVKTVDDSKTEPISLSLNRTCLTSPPLFIDLDLRFYCVLFKSLKDNDFVFEREYLSAEMLFSSSDGEITKDKMVMADSSKNIEQRLRKLETLRQGNLITEEEYQTKKREIMGSL